MMDLTNTTLNPSTLAWGFATIQLLGLLVAGLARYTAGSSLQTHLHRVFYAVLALVGMTTMPALLWGPASCLVSGTTVSVMVLTATWDPSSLR